jgi:hypothetical protein
MLKQFMFTKLALQKIPKGILQTREKEGKPQIGELGKEYIS